MGDREVAGLDDGLGRVVPDPRALVVPGLVSRARESADVTRRRSLSERPPTPHPVTRVGNSCAPAITFVIFNRQTPRG